MLKSFFSAILLLFAGCAELEIAFTPGTITEQLPKLSEKFPVSTKFYMPRPVTRNGTPLFQRSENQLTEAFRAAFKQQGVELIVPEEVEGQQEKILESAEKAGCDYVFLVQLVQWEYGDGGFSGSGARDEVTLNVLIMKPKVKKVVTRATLVARTGFGIIPVYVKHLFK